MSTQDYDPKTPTARELTLRFETLRAMSGAQFELYVAALLRAMGHNTRVLGGSGDQGVDLIVDYFGERVAIQCKNYAKPVGNKPVQEVFTGAKHHGCRQAWVVAPAGFTRGAFALASSVGVKLFDSASIREWISQVDKVAPPDPRSEDFPPSYSVSELMSRQDSGEDSEERYHTLFDARHDQITEKADQEARPRHGAGQRSGRQGPKRLSEEPWFGWGCAMPLVGCLFGGLALLLAFSVWFITVMFGGGLEAVVIAELIVFCGSAGLFYVASRYDTW
jgi:hypothetical protein